MAEKPRAVVAASDDRRYVAALAPGPERITWAVGYTPPAEADGAIWWHYYEWSDEDATLVPCDTFDMDTGQDAADMVEAFAAKMLQYRTNGGEE